ncbi:3'-5' exonuclease [Humibacillus xanthopallidus]|uniref:3'-5' exonuclease n=1 Tax=Humibacillus xanthopallidus TaxID=412689 RepID=UPI00384F4664
MATELKKKAFAFLEKLSTDDTAPGLHIEPIVNSADPRVRTGRVDQGFRAVLHKIPHGRDTTYVFNGVWPHDEAIEIAKKIVLRTNPVIGVTEAILESPEAPHSSTHADILMAAEELSPSFLVTMGHDLIELRDELGLDPKLAERALTAHDGDALLAVGADAPEWQQLALLGLASGDSVAQIKEDLGLAREFPVEGSEDEQLVSGLAHPAARLSFAYVEGSEELRRVIEEGDFGSWRVFLHPAQRRYIERNYNGPFRLSGGAGTGKTVVLIHRARTLAERDPEARILLTTYTRNLANDMRRDLRRLDPEVRLASSLGDVGVYVGGIDQVAAAVIRNAGSDIAVDAEGVLGHAMPKVKVALHNRWQEAIDSVGSPLPGFLRAPSFMQAEYEMVILPNRVTSRQGYFAVSRPGRGVPLDRAKRDAVWDMVEAYRAKGRMEAVVDFGEAAMIAATHLGRVALEEDHFAVDRVLVDEGQDLTPPRWQLLRALVPEQPNDLFIAEDSHQRIYGQRVVLAHHGIRIIGRSQRLTLNYRTTEQNLDYAMTILQGGDYTDLEDATEAPLNYRSARRGPRPTFVEAITPGDELDMVADLLRDWMKDANANEAIAVLVRDKYQGDRVFMGLAERRVPVEVFDGGDAKLAGPVVMTMHRAKGTEFSRVVMIGLGADSNPAGPRDEAYDEDAWKDAVLRERSLHYVAATRARDHLALSWSGKPNGFLSNYRTMVNKWRS